MVYRSLTFGSGIGCLSIVSLLTYPEMKGGFDEKTTLLLYKIKPWVGFLVGGLL